MYVCDKCKANLNESGLLFGLSLRCPNCGGSVTPTPEPAGRVEVQPYCLHVPFVLGCQWCLQHLESQLSRLQAENEYLKSEWASLDESRIAFVKETYKLLGIEDDGEYRWKWVLLGIHSLQAESDQLRKERDAGREIAHRLRERITEWEEDWKRLCAERDEAVGLLRPLARVAECVPDNWNDSNVLIWEQMSANTIRINCLPSGSCDGVTLKEYRAAQSFLARIRAGEQGQANQEQGKGGEHVAD